LDHPPAGVPHLPAGCAGSSDSEASPAANGAAWQISGVRELALELAIPYAELSPDGQWLAGVGPEDAISIWDVAALSPACAEERLHIRAETIAWAPDSSAVAFALDAIRLFEESDIYVFERGSGQQTNLTDDGAEGTVILDVEPGFPSDDVPAWSPDSRRIAFARTIYTEEITTTSLMWVDRVGGDPVEILTLDGEAPFAVETPMYWLQDDSLLYSQRAREISPRDGVWRVGIHGGSIPLQLVPGGATASVPRATIGDVADTSGMAIVYSDTRRSAPESGGEPEFWLLVLDSGTLAPFPIPPVEPEMFPRVADATFAPDGSSILLVVTSLLGLTLTVMDVATGEMAALEAQPPGQMYRPGPPQWALNDTALLQGPEGPILFTLEPVR
jgi:hypothetical protein